MGPTLSAASVEFNRICSGVRGQRQLTKRAQNALARAPPSFLLSSAAQLLHGQRWQLHFGHRTAIRQFVGILDFVPTITRSDTVRIRDCASPEFQP